MIIQGPEGTGERNAEILCSDCGGRTGREYCPGHGARTGRIHQITQTRETQTKRDTQEIYKIIDTVRLLLYLVSVANKYKHKQDENHTTKRKGKHMKNETREPMSISDLDNFNHLFNVAIGGIEEHLTGDQLNVSYVMGALLALSRQLDDLTADITEDYFRLAQKAALKDLSDAGMTA